MITIISKPACANCVKAENYAKANKMEYTKAMLGIDLTTDEFFARFPSVREFPVILKDGVFVGGLKELMAL